LRRQTAQTSEMNVDNPNGPWLCSPGT